MIKELEVNRSIQISSWEDTDIIVCKGKGSCNYQWILDIKIQCQNHHVPFYYISTGPMLIRDGKTYHIKDELQESQANKAAIDWSLNEYLFQRLSTSKFRSQFYLSKEDYKYIQKKGWNTIEDHAYDFISKRLAPAMIPNDGKQTPMRHHPVFKAQHATATCCRSCLYKWHHIPKDIELGRDYQKYIVTIIMEWIIRKYYHKL